MSDEVLLDLGFLTEDERDIINRVIFKDVEVRKQEQSRISLLRRELDQLKEDGIPEDEIESKNERYCARCQTYFGVIWNKGAFCPRCDLKVCKVCRVDVADDGWICTLCSKVREVKAQSGAWFFQGHKEKTGNLFGSMLVRKSLRRLPGSEAGQGGERPRKDKLASYILDNQYQAPANHAAKNHKKSDDRPVERLDQNHYQTRSDNEEQEDLEYSDASDVESDKGSYDEGSNQESQGTRTESERSHSERGGSESSESLESDQETRPVQLELSRYSEETMLVETPEQEKIAEVNHMRLGLKEDAHLAQPSSKDAEGEMGPIQDEEDVEHSESFSYTPAPKFRIPNKRRQFSDSDDPRLDLHRPNDSAVSREPETDSSKRQECSRESEETNSEEKSHEFEEQWRVMQATSRSSGPGGEHSRSSRSDSTNSKEGIETARREEVIVETTGDNVLEVFEVSLAEEDKESSDTHEVDRTSQRVHDTSEEVREISDNLIGGQQSPNVKEIESSFEHLHAPPASKSYESRHISENSNDVTTSVLVLDDSMLGDDVVKDADEESLSVFARVKNWERRSTGDQFEQAFEPSRSPGKTTNQNVLQQTENITMESHVVSDVRDDNVRMAWWNETAGNQVSSAQRGDEDSGSAVQEVQVAAEMGIEDDGKSKRVLLDDREITKALIHLDDTSDRREVVVFNESELRYGDNQSKNECDEGNKVPLLAGDQVALEEAKTSPDFTRDSSATVEVISDHLLNEKKVMPRDVNVDLNVSLGNDDVTEVSHVSQDKGIYDHDIQAGATKDDATQDNVTQDDIMGNIATNDVIQELTKVVPEPVSVGKESAEQNEEGKNIKPGDINLENIDCSIMEDVVKRSSSHLPSDIFIDVASHPVVRDEEPGEEFSTWKADVKTGDESDLDEEPTLGKEPTVDEEPALDEKPALNEEPDDKTLNIFAKSLQDPRDRSEHETVGYKETRPDEDSSTIKTSTSEESPTVEDPSSLDSRESALRAFSETFASVQANQGSGKSHENRDEQTSSDPRVEAHGAFSADSESIMSETSGYVTPTPSDDTSSKRTPSISGDEGASIPKGFQRVHSQEQTPIIITPEVDNEKVGNEKARQDKKEKTPTSRPSSFIEYEEDLDVSFHKYGSGLGNKMLKDQLSMGSRESIASYYSNAGGEVYGKYPVTGEILFGIKYDAKIQEFQVQVHQARDIAAVDEKRKVSDPYVKTYLLPDRSRTGKRKTKVKKNTINPVFDEILTYKISYDEILQRTLWLAVWNHDRFGHNDFLGEVLVPIDEYHQSGFSLEDPEPQWYDLCERQSEDAALSYNGEIVLALKFVPPSAVVSKKKKKKKKDESEKGELHINIIEANNLIAKDTNGYSDPFCKSYLLPDKSKKTKQKTAVVKKSLNPKWNYHFVYDNLTHEELMDRVLELTVWDYDRGSSNEFLGGVRLGLGAGLQEWDDANSEEQAAWNKMLNNPNDWNEVSLTLRDHMGNHQ